MYGKRRIQGKDPRPGKRKLYLLKEKGRLYCALFDDAKSLKHVEVYSFGKNSCHNFSYMRLTVLVR